MAGNRAFAKWVLLILLIAVAGGAMGIPVCNVESTDLLNKCLPAVRGPRPQPPTLPCCAVVKRVNMPCLCRYRNYLPVFGINPSLAFSLPGKCGVKGRPSCA